MKSLKKYNNRPNEEIKLPDGRTIWLSRSPAVNSIVVVEFPKYKYLPFIWKVKYILIGQRGEKAPDYKGYWNLPCGYLDWDESGPEAVAREIEEETGIDISKYCKIDPDKQPVYVNTKPTANKQNVSYYYKFVIKLKDYSQLIDLTKTLTTDYCEEGEVTQVGFIKASTYKEFKFCFNHDEIIKKFVL